MDLGLTAGRTSPPTSSSCIGWYLLPHPLAPEPLLADWSEITPLMKAEPSLRETR